MRQRDLKLIDEYLRWLPNDGSPASFGEISYELLNVGRRVETLADRIPEVQRIKLREFTESHSSPPTWETDRGFNERILIEGGDFLMGSPSGMGKENEHPQRKIIVSPFYIQQHEVTNREYQRFDSAHRLSDERPAIVSWSKAMGYAAWLGGSLPTEAQWEFAARGPGDEGRTYPWGEDPPTPEHANFGHDDVNLVPAGSRPRGATPNSIQDLAGNAWEWCLDYYSDRYLVSGEEPAFDPPGPPRGDERVMRGGSVLSSSPDELRSAARSHFFADGVDDIGFRVVWPRDAGPRAR